MKHYLNFLLIGYHTMAFTYYDVQYMYMKKFTPRPLLPPNENNSLMYKLQVLGKCSIICANNPPTPNFHAVALLSCKVNHEGAYNHYYLLAVECVLQFIFSRKKNLKRFFDRNIFCQVFCDT